MLGYIMLPCDIIPQPLLCCIEAQTTEHEKEVKLTEQLLLRHVVNEERR